VHWIVGYTPGGGNDIFARLMGQWLQERLGQPFVIENRPGAGSNIATEAVVNASPDGYAILLANFANASNASLYANLKFNFIRDIAPIAGIVRVPNIMLVNQSLPVKTIPEFIAYAKANPGKISMASAGIGSTGHLAGELMKMTAGIDFVHVPYRGVETVQTSPNKSSGVGQTLDVAENVSIFVQHGPARSTPVAGTIPGQRG